MTTLDHTEPLWAPSARPRFVIGDPENDDGRVRLLEVGQLGNPVRGAPQLKELSYADLLHSHNEGPATIVLGENGGGLSTLVSRVLRWLRRNVDNYRWRRVVCDLVKPLRLEQELLAASPQKWFASDTELGYAEGNGSKVVLLLEHLQRYTVEDVRSIAPKIRARFEFDRDFGLLMVGEDPFLFVADDELFSPIASVANVYRMPWWSVDEVRQAAKTEITREVAEACIAWTGGQPTLTQDFLLAAQERELPLDEVGYQIVGLQPSSVSNWLPVLRKLCGKQECREIVRALVAGQHFEHAQMPAAGHPLFLAGWMCWTDEARWHMPRCHRHWAREVLLGG